MERGLCAGDCAGLFGCWGSWGGGGGEVLKARSVVGAGCHGCVGG